MKVPSLSNNIRLNDYLFIILFAIISYWPVSFMVYSLKGDAINYFLAMRYNVSEAFQNGIFPFWSPYINLGYPLHADLQTGVWNPLVFLISLTGKYDIYRFHIETILVIIIAGIGMYRLLSYFLAERKVLLCISAAYMTTGLIADGGQFITWLYAAAILPFVFLYTIKCFRELSVRNAFGLGVFHSLMFLCAYTADFILLSYIIALFALLSFFKEQQKKGVLMALKESARQSLIAFVTFVIICLPAILSFWPFLHLIDRGNGISAETSLVNSLSPASLISFFVPWATQKGEIFTDTDPLLRNCYIGIIPFIFFTAYIINKKKKKLFEQFLIFLFFLFLVFSLGKFGGLRLLAYHTLPLMDTFKHPAKTKLFFLFAALLISAFSMQHYTREPQFYKKNIMKILWLLLLVAAFCFLFGLLKSSIWILFSRETTNNISTGTFIKEIRDSFSFYDTLFLNSVVLLIITAISLLLVRKNLLIKFLLPLVCIDVFIILQGMLPLTYVKNNTPSEVAKILNAQPAGYPLPDTASSLALYSQDGMKYFNLMGCMNPYNKKPGRSDYVITPSNLSTQDFFWNYKLFRNKIMKYPLIYVADTVFNIQDTALFLAEESTRKAAVSNQQTNTQEIKLTTTNTKPTNIIIRKFFPGKFEFHVTNSNTALLVLQQNYYPNWKVFVNGVKKEIEPVNITFMGVKLTPGTNKVIFEYSAPLILPSLILSLVFLSTGIFVFFIKRKQKS